jgi:hypothetical protein
MRAVLAIVAVVGLGMLIFLGVSAGEVPTFNLLQPSQGAQQVQETAVGAQAAELVGDQESGSGPIIDLSGITSIGSKISENFSFQSDNRSAVAVNGQCWPVVINPGFEERTGWDLPITEYSAEYNQEEVFAGSWSVRTGITDTQDNVESWSSVSQLITIPPNIDSATLTFHLLPKTSESPNLAIPKDMAEARNAMASAMRAQVGDAQWVFVLDQHGNILERLVTMRSNDDAWSSYSFDLSAYANTTIRIYFGSFNNGWDGVTALFVDEVQLTLCADVAPPPTETPIPSPTLTPTNTRPPTNTPTYTPVPSDTPTPSDTPVPTDTVEPTDTPVPTPTATSEPLVCEEALLDGGFEDMEGWHLPITYYTAAYVEAPDPVLAGTYSMRTGITVIADNIESWSSAMQLVEIPDNATVADLSFNIYPQTSEPADLVIPQSFAETMAKSSMMANLGDAQWVFILDRFGNELDRLVAMRSNSQTWELREASLLDYRGMSIYIYFGTYNNGWGGITSMHVDEVSLEVCTGGGGPVYTQSNLLPAIFGDVPLGISGRLTDGEGTPQAGEVVELDSGPQATTDSDGYYYFNDLDPDTYTVFPPPANGITYIPPSQVVIVPPSAGDIDFSGATATPDPYP